MTIIGHLIGLGFNVGKFPSEKLNSGIYIQIVEGQAVPALDLYPNGAVYSKTVDVVAFFRNLDSTRYPTNDTPLQDALQQIISMREFIDFDSSGCRIQDIQIDLLPSIVPDISSKGLVATTRYRLTFTRI